MKAHLSAIFNRIASRFRIQRTDCKAIIQMESKAGAAILPLLILWLILDPSWIGFMAFLAVAMTYALAYLWARQMASHLYCLRVLQYIAIQVGDEMEETVKILNNSGLPAVWLELVDLSDVPGYDISLVTGVDNNSDYFWRSRTTCEVRGEYRLGPWELQSGDPLGLFKVRLVYEREDKLLVYPPLCSLPATLFPRNKNRGEERSLNQPLMAETQSAMTVRPYQHGDPLRFIHWRTTARKGDLFTRVFSPEAFSTIWLLGDFDRRVHAGKGMEGSLEKMVVLLATLADHFLNRRLAVGMMFPGGAEAIVPPKRGELQRWALLRGLARQEAHDLPLGGRLAKIQPFISIQDALLVVTPSTQAEWTDALRGQSPSRASQAMVLLLDTGENNLHGSLVSLETLLQERGIATRTIPCSEIQPISGTYGDLNRWEFITLGTGKVVARQKPRARSALAEAPGPGTSR